MSQPLREEYLSPFYDQSAVHAWLEDKPMLLAGAREMCATFGLQAAVGPKWEKSRHGSVIHLYTKQGFFAGGLRYTRAYGGRKGASDIYIYNSPYISKDRASSRSNRSERDSEKITGIINALKRNLETPTMERLTQAFISSARFTFSAIENSVKANPTISLSDAATLALTKMFILDDTVSVESFRSQIESSYKSYVDRMEKWAESAKDIERFNKGCTIVGIMPDMTNELDGYTPYYVVADGARDASKNMTLTNIKRYNKLSESPIAADAVMIRTYLESKTNLFDRDNEIGISCKDIYLPDIDVAVGYMSASQGTWVAIPKHGF